MTVDGDGDGEALAATTSAHKSGDDHDPDEHTEGSITTIANSPQITKLGHLVLHDSGVVAKLATVVVVVASPDRDQGAVGHLLEGKDPEGHGQGLVGPPVVGQGRAEDARRAGLDQLTLIAQELLQQVIGYHDVSGHDALAQNGMNVIN